MGTGLQALMKRICAAWSFGHPFSDHPNGLGRIGFEQIVDAGPQGQVDLANARVIKDRRAEIGFLDRTCRQWHYFAFYG